MSLRDCDKSRREQKEEKTSAFSELEPILSLVLSFPPLSSRPNIMSLLELSSKLAGEDFDVIPVM